MQSKNAVGLVHGPDAGAGSNIKSSFRILNGSKKEFVVKRQEHQVMTLQPKSHQPDERKFGVMSRTELLRLKRPWHRWEPNIAHPLGSGDRISWESMSHGMTGGFRMH